MADQMTTEQKIHDEVVRQRERYAVLLSRANALQPGDGFELWLALNLLGLTPGRFDAGHAALAEAARLAGDDSPAAKERLEQLHAAVPEAFGDWSPHHPAGAGTATVGAMKGA